ncbi:response regulator [Paenibacillus radicis (ex Xue et al. 2023)]|uniref:Transcriptional regulatory protein n=1 Tax=Paenibacillus radicis (ex Xue et al. 2023) TaxID=2972489 RepID=A0ABT1YEW5_9BACL|nr:response regulator [Paenibacillus radicis (ex Xue et al. 2023)]MCR8631741.1 response regulator [Paenibacillus radicis (ex Xue et al. 2023)]
MTKELLELIRVLIIEDDERIAEINRRFVEKVSGFTVVGIATDRPQAITLLEVLEPDLVLLDIYFPDANGLELLQHIRQLDRQPDVIMITAAKEVDAVRAAIRGGVFDFIMKPLLFNRLQETLLRFKEYHRTLERLHTGPGQVNQDEVDQLLQGTSKKEAVITYLPKGIDKLTLDKVIQAMNDIIIPLTAEQAAGLIGVSRSTARRYLEHLVSQGQLRADLSYGDVGRPERVYRKM